jgi:hypothetical protein
VICISLAAVPPGFWADEQGASRPGADADITDLHAERRQDEDVRAAAAVIKSGVVIVDQGEIREPLTGKLLYVSPEYDTEHRVRHRRLVREVLFDPLPQLPVPLDYLHDARRFRQRSVRLRDMYAGQPD